MLLAVGTSEQKCFRVLPFLLALVALSSTIARAATTRNSSSFRIPTKDANITAISPVTVAKRNQATVRNIAPKLEEHPMSFSSRMAILATVLGVVALLFLLVWIIHFLRRRSKMIRTITPVDDADEEKERGDDESNSNDSKYNDELPRAPSLKQFESRQLEEFEGMDAKVQQEEAAYDTKHNERSEMAPHNGQHGPASRADVPNKTGRIMNGTPKHVARSAPFSNTGDNSKMSPLLEQKQTGLNRGDRQPASGSSPIGSNRKTTEPFRERTESGESQRSTGGDGHAKNKKRRRKNPKKERRGSAKIQPMLET